MASTVKVRFRSYLPGSGFDSAGNPKQGKTRVVGRISVTSYNGQGGEPLKPVDVGLSVIDAIRLRVSDEAAGDHVSGKSRGVIYSASTGHFYLFTNQMTTGALTGYTATATETLEFVAEGDSARDVELT